ncbi:hypothetical protein RFI_12305 [Reticulomyxa filosa]|uniref:Uncharacterized protein n=1 Tax=Reticulomyxa filosa TaxID=46433 RepID=X6NFW2_RETFI|nr:hypothetical protein RFI_12305 [Reticulomyxa filosa]|eukprot:ETO24851.1 hypothetical protein RFI_12305 [Reticulomyxa filosa]
MEIENENSEAKRENNIFRIFQYMSDQNISEEMESLQKAKKSTEEVAEAICDLESMLNEKKTILCFRRLVHKKLKKDLEDTMEETSNWRLSLVKELAKSKVRIDTSITIARRLKSTMTRLRKEINQESNISIRNCKTKKISKKIKKWGGMVEKNFQETMTSWKTIWQDAENLRIKWGELYTSFEQFRFYI